MARSVLLSTGTWRAANAVEPGAALLVRCAGHALVPVLLTLSLCGQVDAKFLEQLGQLRKARLFLRRLWSSGAQPSRRHGQRDGNPSRKSNRRYRIAHIWSPLRESGSGFVKERSGHECSEP